MATSLMFGNRHANHSLIQRIRNLNWMVVLVVLLIAGIGFAMLYSVAGGDMQPWATRQAIRFGIGFGLMLLVALVDLRLWMAAALPLYILTLLLLLAVEFFGATGMGGQRWLDIGFLRLQPSELMKVALVLVLAAYFHTLSQHKTEKFMALLIPLLLIGIPAYLVVRQPDLGTAIMLVGGGIAVLFIAGIRGWIFLGAGIAAVASVPVVWSMLHDYQKDRVLTFLDPERDPLGAGYQILQSKIAMGSGGLFGKGFLQGTQSQLNFLPEMKTDFIFTVLTEEFGLIGGLGLLSLYLIVIIYGLYVSLTCRSQFGRLLAMGLALTIFLYVFINVAMVMGLLPVVGVPLPLVSYGGSAMITVMVAIGMILSVALNRGVNISRNNPFG